MKPETITHANEIPPMRRAFVAYRTLARKEINRFTRIWLQTLIPPAVTMTLYFLIFGTLIGERVGQMDGYDYMDFIVPGLIMMAVITNSYTNVVSSAFSAKFQRHIEEMLVSPMPNWCILLGYITGGVSRALLVGCIVTGVSFFFTKLDIHHLPLTILVVVLTSILFATAGFINAIFARKFDDVSIVPTFILTPLTYLGGVFYSISMLPEWAQWLSRANPILYMVNAFRYGILGQSDINIYVALAMIVVFIVVFYVAALQFLKRGIGIRT